MSSINSSNLRAHLTDVLDDVQWKHKRVIVTSKGKKRAAIVSIDDLMLLKELEDRIDLEDARKALKDVKKNGSLSSDELKKELDL